MDDLKWSLESATLKKLPDPMIQCYVKRGLSRSEITA